MRSLNAHSAPKLIARVRPISVRDSRVVRLPVRLRTGKSLKLGRRSMGKSSNPVEGELLSMVVGSEESCMRGRLKRLCFSRDILPRTCEPASRWLVESETKSG